MSTSRAVLCSQSPLALAHWPSHSSVLSPPSYNFYFHRWRGTVNAHTGEGDPAGGEGDPAARPALDASLGDDDADQLPTFMRDFHNGVEGRELRVRGTFTVKRGEGWARQLLATLGGLPRAGDDVDVVVRSILGADGGVNWSRSFDGELSTCLSRHAMWASFRGRLSCNLRHIMLTQITGTVFGAAHAQANLLKARCDSRTAWWWSHFGAACCPLGFICA